MPEAEPPAGTGPAPLVGRVWPAREWEAEPAKLREYASAVGETAPIYHEAGAARALGFGDLVAAPAFAAVVVAPAVAAVIFDPEVGLFDPEVGISSYRFVHKRQLFRWHRPIVAGDVLTTRASLADASTAPDGRAGRVFESETVDAAGEPVVSARYEGVVPHAGGKREGVAGAGSAPAPPATAAPAARAPTPPQRNRLVAGHRGRSSFRR